MEYVRPIARGGGLRPFSYSHRQRWCQVATAYHRHTPAQLLVPGQIASIDEH